MRRLLAAAAAALTMGLFAPASTQAMPLAQSKTFGAAVDRISPIDKVRYCEYFDPDLGEYVVFWVPGSCLRVGSAGFYPWLGRYYTGGRYWRGRLGARPWVRGNAFYGRGYRGARGVVRREGGRVGARPGFRENGRGVDRGPRFDRGGGRDRSARPGGNRDGGARNSGANRGGGDRGGANRGGGDRGGANRGGGDRGGSNRGGGNSRGASPGGIVR